MRPIIQDMSELSLGQLLENYGQAYQLYQNTIKSVEINDPRVTAAENLVYLAKLEVQAAGGRELDLRKAQEKSSLEPQESQSITFTEAIFENKI